MNIFVINGSPKGERSNTWQLTKAFLAGIETQLGTQSVCIRTVETRSASIQPCLGCFSCWKNEGNCCLRDDMAQVIQNLVWADVTIWSFPLYYFSVPGPLKNLIDRQLPMALPFMTERTDGLGSGSHPARYDMSHKRTVVISTCGFYSAEGNYDGVRSLFDHMCGTNNYELIACGQGELFRVPELAERTGAYLNTVQQAGREFACGTITPTTKAQLDELLFARQTFEAMADASWGISRETGKAEDESITFTRQMAALYSPASFDGTNRVLEMHYTDRDIRCTIVLGSEKAEVVTDGSVPYTTRINTPYTVWQDIAQGKISGSEAMMRHLYTVDGDFDLMLNWDTYFGGQETQTTEKPTPLSSQKPSTMLAMLLPWIAFWVSFSIDANWGIVVTLAVCALTSLVFYSHERTPYDTISPALVLLLAATYGAGVPLGWLLPCSYVCFGAMWLVSVFLPIPLSAHYSKSSYGGDQAFQNVIFVTTNRIICAVWGITYLVAALVTVVLMNSGVTSLVALINQLLPLPAGIFTVWFQRWYPRKVAQG